MIRLRIPNSILRLFFHDPQETKNTRLTEINSVIEFCKHILIKKEKFVILDTETTGLGEKDIVIQIGIIDLNGNEILNTFVRSNKLKRISSEASRINGIKPSDLKFAPLFEEIIDVVYKLSLSKTFLIFNANFDNRMLQQTIEFNNLRRFKIKAYCIQKLYSIYVGEWSEYHKDYKKQSLPNAKHSAIDDCLSVLNLIREISDKEYLTIPEVEYKLFGIRLN